MFSHHWVAVLYLSLGVGGSELFAFIFKAVINEKLFLQAYFYALFIFFQTVLIIYVSRLLDLFYVRSLFELLALLKCFIARSVAASG